MELADGIVDGCRCGSLAVWEFTMTPHAPKPQSRHRRPTHPVRSTVRELFAGPTDQNSTTRRNKSEVARHRFRFESWMHCTIPVAPWELKNGPVRHNEDMEEWNWKDYVVIGLGLDEDK